MRRKAADRKYRKRLRIVRLLWGVAGLLLVTLLIEMVLAACLSPRFWVHTITVRGAQMLTRTDVIRLMALPPRSNFFRAPLSKLADRIAVDPRVQEVRVRRGAVGELVVDLRERAPLCRLDYVRPPVYLDAQGVLFAQVPAPETLVPVIDGVTIPPARLKLGTQLADAAVTQACECLTALSDTSLGTSPVKVARVKIEDNGYFTLVLQPGTKVFLGPPKNFRIKTWWLHRSIVQASTDGYALNKIEYFDFRFVDDYQSKSASFAPKGAQVTSIQP